MYANGEDVRTLAGAAVMRRRSGYMLQLAETFSASLTVRENLCYAAALRFHSDLTQAQPRQVGKVALSQIVNVLVHSHVELLQPQLRDLHQQSLEQPQMMAATELLMARPRQPSQPAVLRPSPWILPCLCCPPAPCRRHLHNLHSSMGTS